MLKEKEHEEINKRKKRLEEYVNELFRVYVKVRKPTPEEVEAYVNDAISGITCLSFEIRITQSHGESISELI